MPQISVIVPVYNVEKYLSRCIDSILNQIFSDFELILIDDGSTDKSGEICDEYLKKDDRVKVIHKEYGGVSSARNAGLNMVAGEYIMFVDSDDYIEPEFISELYHNIINNDVDISIVNFHKFNDEKSFPAVPVDEGILKGIDMLDSLSFSSISVYAVVLWNKIYKRSLFDGIRFPEGRIYEDSFTMHKLYHRAKNVYLSNNDLYCYYQRPGSIMNRAINAKAIEDRYGYLCERADYFKNNGLEYLYLKDNKLRLTTIKEMTAKIIEGNFDKKLRKKYFSLFKKDISENFKSMTSGRNFAERLGDYIYKISPEIFYRLSKIKTDILKYKK